MTHTKLSGYIKIPKVLLSDPQYATLTPIDVLTYGCLADRSSLSHRNACNWTNDRGEVYIRYTVAELMGLLHCGKDTVRKILDRLVKAGLILLRRTAISKPYQIIVLDPDTADYPVTQGDNPVPSNTNTNHPDVSKPNCNNPHPINMSRDEARNTIRTNINYHSKEATTVDIIIDHMVDVIVDPTPTLRIAGVNRPRSDVVSTLLHLSRKHIDYVAYRVQQDLAGIKSLRGYILMTLWDSVAAINLSTQPYDEDLVAAVQRMSNDTTAQ